MDQLLLDRCAQLAQTVELDLMMVTAQHRSNMRKFALARELIQRIVTIIVFFAFSIFVMFRLHCFVRDHQNRACDGTRNHCQLIPLSHLQHTLDFGGSAESFQIGALATEPAETRVERVGVHLVPSARRLAIDTLAPPIPTPRRAHQ